MEFVQRLISFHPFPPPRVPSIIIIPMSIGKNSQMTSRQAVAFHWVRGYLAKKPCSIKLKNFVSLKTNRSAICTHLFKFPFTSFSPRKGGKGTEKPGSFKICKTRGKFDTVEAGWGGSFKFAMRNRPCDDGLLLLLACEQNSLFLSLSLYISNPHKQNMCYIASLPLV